MNKRTSQQHKSLAVRLLKYSGIILIGLLVVGYFIGTRYYSKHYYKNTIINGIDCSNKTIDEAITLLRHEADNYILSIEERNDVVEHIIGSDIDFTVSFGNTLDNLLKKQSSYLWFTGLFKKSKNEFDSMISYDSKKLKAKINELKAFDSSYVEKPMNAYISEYTEDGYTIVEASQGNQLKKKIATKYIIQAVKEFKDSINFDDYDNCYVKPTIFSDDKTLNSLVETMNQYCSTVLTYHFGDVTEVLDGSIIHTWLSVNNNQVVLDENKVKDYVDYIGRTYNSFGRTRTFKTSYDKPIKLKGGDYGWWLNRVAERNEIIEAIKVGKQGEKKPVYYQTAYQYGSDDIGDTYVEVNLSAQHLYFYVEGNLIVESDFVSGNVAKNHGTPVGTYGITYKERDATLVGEDYEQPVKYWMPFNGSIGLHDANWRKEFGKGIFLTRGSHGCINLPPKVAQKIYENISKGTPVICYELPGTENYEVKDKKTSKKDKNKEAELNSTLEQSRND